MSSPDSFVSSVEEAAASLADVIDTLERSLEARNEHETSPELSPHTRQTLEALRQRQQELQATIAAARHGVAQPGAPNPQFSELGQLSPAYATRMSDASGSVPSHTPSTPAFPTRHVPDPAIPWHAQATPRYRSPAVITPLDTAAVEAWMEDPSQPVPFLPDQAILAAEQAMVEAGYEGFAPLRPLQEACASRSPHMATWIREEARAYESWDSFKVAFVRECYGNVGPDILMAYLPQIRLGPAETLSEYERRFRAVFERSGMSESSEAAMICLRKSLTSNLIRLFEEVRERHQTVLATLKALVLMARQRGMPTRPGAAQDFETEPSIMRRPPLLTRSLARETATVARVEVQAASSAPRSRPPFCRFCRKSGHAIQQCPDPACEVARRHAAGIPAPSTEGVAAKSSHVRSVAAEAITASTPVTTPRSTDKGSSPPMVPLNAVLSLLQQATMSQASINNCLYSVFSCSQASNPADTGSDFVLSITVFGRTLRALVDTGSQRSIVHPKHLPNNTVLRRTESEFFQVQGGRLDVLGEIESVQVTVGQTTRSLCLVAMPIATHDLILGQDAFREFGMVLSIPSISLVPWSHPAEPDSLTVLENGKTQILDLPISKKDQQSIMFYCKEALTANSATAHTFCTLPEAQVSLPIEPSTKPVHTPQYRIPTARLPLAKKVIDGWLADGIIELAPVGTTWNHPVLAVPKGTDAVRLCLDPRVLNAVLLDDKHPIPSPRELVEQCRGFRIFTSLDLKSSFNQFPIVPEDRPKTAFTFEGVQYVFVGAPFGIKTLTSIFQRVMSRLLANKRHAVSFVDDVIIHSATLADHLVHVKDIIDCLTSANLTLNLEKCKFGYTSIRALGLVVSEGGISVDTTKLEGIKSLPFPTTASQMRSFLGLANYFREHLPNFAAISRPLDPLRNTEGTIKPTSEQRVAFELVKALLLRAEFLKFPDPDLPFTVWTDASSSGLGAVLAQQSSSDAPLNIVMCASRALTSSESNYRATRRETLGIVFALSKFQHYLAGRKFKLLTDHKALTYFASQTHLSPLLWGWAEFLSSFDMELGYCPGKDNILADHLSRLHAAAPQSVCSLGTTVPDPSEEAVREELLQAAHGLGHHNYRHVVEQIRAWGEDWPGLTAMAKAFVSKCKICLRRNPPRSPPHGIWDSVSAAAPFDHVCVDLVTMSPDRTGARYALVLVDVASRFLLIRALSDKSAESVAQCLAPIFADFGPPSVLQTDQGREFTGRLINHLLLALGVNQHFTTPYHPESNGLAERHVRSFLHQLRAIAHDDNDWVSAIPAVQWSMNTLRRPNQTYTAFEVMFGRECRVFDDHRGSRPEVPTRRLIRQWIQARRDVLFPRNEDEKLQIIDARKGLNPPPSQLPAGTAVAVRNPVPRSKTSPLFLGPFVVVRRLPNGTYQLMDPSGLVLPRPIPRSHLKLHHSDTPAVSSRQGSDGELLMTAPRPLDP